MEVTDAEVFEISESSQVSDARRRMLKYGSNFGLVEKAQDRLALVCTELATNLLKHTEKGGNLIVQGIKQNDLIGVEVYSFDSGRGMDTTACLKDGHSSAGTLGTGLGAIQRMSDEFNIISEIGTGTVVHARVWNDPIKEPVKFSEGGLTVPKNGEQLSGDKWLIERDEKQVYCMLVDGLGHGIEACEAASLAKKRFRENLNKSPSAMIRALHTALRGSRGAVGAVARIDLISNTLDYCGLGNIAGIICDGSNNRHLVSMNGTLGYETHKINEFRFPWTNESTLVMYSDGLSSKTGHGIENLLRQPAALIAGWLYQRNTKNSDDSTVLVFKGKNT